MGVVGCRAFSQSLDKSEKGLSDPRSPGSQVSNAGRGRRRCTALSSEHWVDQVLDAVGKWAANTTGVSGLEPLPVPTTIHCNSIT